MNFFPLRRLVERFSRELVFTRRLPPRFGRLRLHVSPGAGLAFYKPLGSAHWRDLHAFADRYVQPGQVVWDIGSNVGVFTFAAAFKAGITGSVLAVEPDLWSARLLQRSAAGNRGHAAPVSILPAAVCDRLSVQTLVIPQRSRGASHLGSHQGASADITGGERERHPVIGVTLDWLAGHFPTPDILKIDVDGSERLVIEGARDLLCRHHPVILIEVFERNGDAVTAQLHAAGYTLYDFDGGRCSGPIVRTAYNTLALPPGKTP